MLDFGCGQLAQLSPTQTCTSHLFKTWNDRLLKQAILNIYSIGWSRAYVLTGTCLCCPDTRRAANRAEAAGMQISTISSSALSTV
jgi:hypothetical protein